VRRTNFVKSLAKPSFSSLPTAIGNLTRLASARVQGAGIKLEPLVLEAGLSLQQIKDRSARIAVQRQIRFLDQAAGALKDDLLGFHLARDCDIRELGLLYYVVASSQTLGDGLRRLSRYTSVVNESVVLKYIEGSDVRIIIDYVGIPRHSDRHQIATCLTIVVRLCRHITARRLVPIRIKIAHGPDGEFSELATYLGCEIEFNATGDEIVFAGAVSSLPVLSADPYLSDLLIAQCEEAMAQRSATRSTLELTVKNAIAPVLPHGEAVVGRIARHLGMSDRTLSRRLASEGLTFTAILETLRQELAGKYLSDPALPIFRIAWLLGYQEESAFRHAFKRWTGAPPREARNRAARLEAVGN
jgi:AraC-like DNA-binding protein